MYRKVVQISTTYLKGWATIFLIRPPVCLERRTQQVMRGNLSGLQVTTRERQLNDTTVKVLATPVHPEGKPLIWTIVLWDVIETENRAFKLQGFRRIGEFDGYTSRDDRHLVFSPEGNLSACFCSSYSMVRVWKADTGKELSNYQCGDTRASE